MEKLVGIIMGSDSDLSVVKGATDMLEELQIGYEAVISSAHRTPAETKKFAEGAAKRGLKVIIAAAGGAAHLPGVVAAYTSLPVIGIPIKTSTLSGVDSLYSIVQMPGGIPVATMAINGAKNAALFAAQILALSDTAIEERLKQYKEKMASDVIKKNGTLQQNGVDGYLKMKEGK